MRRAVFILLTIACSVWGHCFAQGGPQVARLSTSTPLRTEAPFRTLIGPRLCDSSGSVYIRYFPAKGAPVFSAPVTKIETGGSIKSIPIGRLPNGDSDLAAFAVGSTKLFEVLLLKPPRSSAATETYYAEFDQDGGLISKSAFALEGLFFPNLFVPLPTGDFFAAGTEIVSGKDKATSTRRAIAAVFGPDAVIKRLVSKASQDDPDFGSQTDEIANGAAYLGDDQKIYVFRASNPVQVQVVTQTGKIERSLKLSPPQPKAEPTAMFVSGGRIVVSWVSGDNQDTQTRVALYDSQSGSLMRIYAPDYNGSLVCFEGGTSLKILTVMEAGFFGLATATLQ